MQKAKVKYCYVVDPRFIDPNKIYEIVIMMDQQSTVCNFVGNIIPTAILSSSNGKSLHDLIVEKYGLSWSAVGIGLNCIEESQLINLKVEIEVNGTSEVFETNLKTIFADSMEDLVNEYFKYTEGMNGILRLRHIMLAMAQNSHKKNFKNYFLIFKYYGSNYQNNQKS